MAERNLPWTYGIFHIEKRGASDKMRVSHHAAEIPVFDARGERSMVQTLPIHLSLEQIDMLQLKRLGYSNAQVAGWLHMPASAVEYAMYTLRKQYRKRGLQKQVKEQVAGFNLGQLEKKIIASADALQLFSPMTHVALGDISRGLDNELGVKMSTEMYTRQPDVSAKEFVMNTTGAVAISQSSDGKIRVRYPSVALQTASEGTVTRTVPIDLTLAEIEFLSLKRSGKTDFAISKLLHVTPDAVQRLVAGLQKKYVKKVSPRDGQQDDAWLRPVIQAAAQLELLYPLTIVALRRIEEDSSRK